MDGKDEFVKRHEAIAGAWYSLQARIVFFSGAMYRSVG